MQQVVIPTDNYMIFFSLSSFKRATYLKNKFALMIRPKAWESSMTRMCYISNRDKYSVKTTFLQLSSIVPDSVFT